MSDLRWNPSMETGDPLVDEQHQNIHRLVDYVERSASRPELLMGMLEQLMEHVYCHFATEEALMMKTGFDGDATAEHVAEHRKLTNGARDFVLRFRSGQLSEVGPLVGFLRDWLAVHVHQSDMRFIGFVRARGVRAELPEPWATSPIKPIKIDSYDEHPASVRDSSGLRPGQRDVPRDE